MTAPQTEATTAVWFRVSPRMCCLIMFVLVIAMAVAAITTLRILEGAAESWPRVYVSGVTLSSLDVSSSVRQLNGTWHIDFSLPYKAPLGGSFSGESAVVSVYYKGKFLAGAKLHAFVVTSKHPMHLEVNLDASRSDVSGWLADDLMEDKRLGAVEFDVQFVTKGGGERATYRWEGD